MLSSFNVVEIFDSIQFEGSYHGTPATFVRFAGCNRRCSFCDTDHTRYEILEIEDIVDRVKHSRLKHVVLTGGEPLLSIRDNLIRKLMLIAKIHIETNGSLPCEWSFWPSFHITCSPKQRIEDTHLQGCTDLKIVTATWDDIGGIDFVKKFKYENLYFQPTWPLIDRDIELTIELAKKYSGRISIQGHKFMGMR